MIYSSNVISGFGRGKKMGFPTFNLVIPMEFPEKFGVYAARVWVEDKEYKGALFFGPLLTFEGKEATLEIYLLDFTDGQEVKKIDFKLLKYLRPVKKFSSEKGLAKQIKRDVEDIKSITKS